MCNTVVKLMEIAEENLGQRNEIKKDLSHKNVKKIKTKNSDLTKKINMNKARLKSDKN